MADILWHNQNTGATLIWRMNGPHDLDTVSLPGASPSEWQIVATADTDADGYTDIIWRNSSGGVLVWLADGAEDIATSGSILTVATTWQVRGVGDFDANGTDDLFWQKATGETAIWFMSGSATTSQVPTPSAPGWDVIGIGDFDGDDKADVLFENGSTNEGIVWFMNGAAVRETVAFDSAVGFTRLIGDFDGDGFDDVAIQEPSGNLRISFGSAATPQGWSMSSPVYVDTLLTSYTITQAGDFNGDGRDDMLVRNESNGDVALSISPATWVPFGGPSPTFVEGVSLSWRVGGVGRF
ncbi:MAG: VCBS repeat-containing protein [Myxococcota bacterium]